jgi:probable HAF family extracellular repeat protein
MKPVYLLICAASISHATLPACTTPYQYSCQSPTLGGYTVITPLPATGSIEIAGYTAGGTAVFDQTIPIPPSGVAVSDGAAQETVAAARVQVAITTGSAQVQLTFPACANTTQSLCVALNPGGAIVVTNSTTSSWVTQDTPLTQAYSTTVKALLNGSQTVYQQTFALPYSDSAVQNAVAAADAALRADNATPSNPVQTFNSITQGNPPSYTLVSDTTATGNTTVSSAAIFGPAMIAVGDNQGDFLVVLAGQEDINVNTNNEYYVERNVVTPATSLTTQIYQISGASATSPCDVNRDGSVNASDVQQLINQASGIASPANDLNGDGRVNVIDVEIDIDAALNKGCLVSGGSVAAVPLSNNAVRLRGPIESTSIVHAGNNRSELVGSTWSDDGLTYHAFLVQGGRMTDLGTLGGAESSALAIDVSGRIVGWSDTADGARHAFLWRAGQMEDLNELVNLEDGIVLEEATAIDDSGHITAIGSDGRNYRIAPPPE